MAEIDEFKIEDAIQKIKDLLIEDYTLASKGEDIPTESGDYFDDRHDQIVWDVDQILNEIDNMVTANRENFENDD